MILLLLAALLTSYIPVWAAVDSIELYGFEMRPIQNMPSFDSAPVVYNTAYSAEDARTYYGRQLVDGVWNAWVNINYDTIGTEADYTAYCMQFTNENRVPELSKDFSEAEDKGSAVFKVKLEDSVDRSNLYFVVAAKNADGVSYAGVPVSNYIDVDETEKAVCIPLKLFTKAENFIGSTGTEAALDLSAFCGMGLVRKHSGEEQDPASSGKIYFSKMALAALDAIDDLTAQPEKREIVLSFTAPALESIDQYILTITDEHGNERNLTLTAADFETDGNRYVWRDTEAEEEVSYQYKIKLHESEFGLESAYSNSASAMLAEDIGGEDIPVDNASSVVELCEARNFTWPIPEGKHWCTSTKGGLSDKIYNAYISAGSFGMGSGRVIGYDLGYDNLFATEEEAASQSSFMVDYFLGGLYVTDQVFGGSSGKEKESINVSAAAETGYVVYKMYVEPTVDMKNAYIMMGSNWYKGDKDASIIMGVPLTDYISEEDKGKYITVCIPLTDFRLSNPNIFQRIWTYTWSTQMNDRVEFDFTHLNYFGLLRDCGEDVEKNPTSGFVYVSDMMICDVKPVTDLRAEDVTPEKVVLGWEHSSTRVEKYNIYRVENGERVLAGTSVTNRFLDMNDGMGFAEGETYTYVVEAVDAYGVPSPAVQTRLTVQPLDRPRKFKAEPYYSDTDTLAVDISWAPAEYGEIAEYVLYKDGREFQRFNTDVFSFRDTELTAHTKYTYTMRSVALDGQSSMETNRVTISAACLPAAGNLQYTAEGQNSVALSWSAAAYAEGYEIYINREFAAQTKDTSYTAHELPYNQELEFSVCAINAAGARSDSVYTRKVFLRNPDVVITQEIFEDSVGVGFALANSVNAVARITTDQTIEGDKALMCSFPVKMFDDQTVGFSGKWDVKGYRENGAKLCFWIYAEDNVDLSKLRVGLGTTTTLSWTNVPLRTMLTLKDYVSDKGKWSYVEIPFADFSETGVAVSDGEETSLPIDFSTVKELAFLYNNAQTLDGSTFYLDDVNVQQGNAWSVVQLMDDRGDTVKDSISAAAKAVTIEFDKPMDAASLNSETVWLEAADGNAVNTYGVYQNGVYTLNLLEPLSINTAYALQISGAKSADGMSGSWENRLTSNEDTPGTVTYRIPDIVPQISFAVSGSAVTVSLQMPNAPVYAIQEYKITVKYDQTTLRPNGANAVKLIGLAGGKVVQTDEEITISGNFAGRRLSGELAKLQFAAQKTAQTTLAVSGNAEVYHVRANKTAEAVVSAQKAVSVSVGGSGGSGNGGSPGSGSAAGRGQATVAGDTPIKPSDTQTVETVSFTDLYEAPWAADSITALAREGYISGYPDNTFRPLNSITREEFAALIVRLFRFTTENTTCTFTDVPEDAWYRQSVITAWDKGIISGIDEHSFGTGQTITRQDMCTMVYRAMQAARMTPDEKYDAYIFADQDAISDYALEAVGNLYKYGIISGVSETEFAPADLVNRAMAAKVLDGVNALM